MRYDFGHRDSVMEAAWLIAVPGTLVLTVLIAGLIIL